MAKIAITILGIVWSFLGIKLFIRDYAIGDITYTQFILNMVCYGPIIWLIVLFYGIISCIFPNQFEED